MSKSRLAQLRADQNTLFLCLGFSALIAGSLTVQAISKSREEQGRQQHMQAQQADQSRKAAQAKAQLKANIKAWEQWRDYIEPQCDNTVPRLERGKSYRPYRIHGSQAPVYDGLVICDRNTVGILKGAMLTPAYIVPRAGSPYPMPSGPPPPEFAPLQPNP